MIDKRKWWLLLVTTSGTSLVFLDNTVMPVALPAIQQELGFSQVSLVWIVNAYLLTLAALLLIGGRLSDLFGRRSIFIWGLSLLGVGALVSAVAYHQATLLLGRVVQGMGGALASPATSALLMSHFPEGERARAIGLNTGISSIFLILGPAVGGLLTHYFSWRSIFFLKLPIVFFGITMAFLLLRPSRRSQEPFHFFGALILLLGISLFVTALMQASSWGWTSLWTLSFLLLGISLSTLFLYNSLQTRHPIVNLRLFRNSHFTLANLSLFIVQIVVMVTVFWAIYFQNTLHYSAVKTGLVIFLATFPVLVMAPLGGYCADRFGPRTPLIAGYTILTAALLWFLCTLPFNHLLLLLPGLLGFGCGLPLIMAPTITLGLSQIAPKQLGAASAINFETRQLGATMGLALLNALFQGVIAATDSPTKGLVAISLLVVVFSIAGLLLVSQKLKKGEDRACVHSHEP